MMRKKNSLRVAQVLLAHGANPNASDNNKQTPLFILCGNAPHMTSFIKFLLASGANPNITDGSKTLPLTLAIKNTQRDAQENYVELLRLLIENGANANARPFDNMFDCPIAAAIEVDNSEIIELLISAGLEISLPIRVSRFGNTTPLDYAIRLNKKNAQKILLKYGAKASPKPKR